MRVPEFLNNFLLNRGFQDATLDGEQWLDSGVELWEQGGRAFLRVISWRALFRFVLGFNNKKENK